MIKKKEDITAVILAGGMGARLRGVIGDSQKVLAQVNGAPFITYLLKQIASFRIRKVVLCTGYKAETVKEEIGENIFGLEISYSEEIEPLGTGGAIISALTKVSTEYLLIMNGDSFLDYNLNDLIKWYNDRFIPVGILLTQVDNVSRFGLVTSDLYNRIISFDEKGKSSGSGYINAGAYIMNKIMLKNRPVGVNCSLEKDVFPELISTQKLYGFKTSGKFIDIGTQESLLIAESFFNTSFL